LEDGREENATDKISERDLCWSMNSKKMKRRNSTDLKEVDEDSIV
jgi:hypothetical protein